MNLEITVADLFIASLVVWNCILTFLFIQHVRWTESILAVIVVMTGLDIEKVEDEARWARLKQWGIPDPRDKSNNDEEPTIKRRRNKP